MTQNNWDEKLKESMERRMLQPSSTSWDKLAERLEDEKRRKRKKYLSAISIAASVVGLFLAVNVMLLNDDVEVGEQKIVKSPVVNNSDETYNGGTKSQLETSKETPKNPISNSIAKKSEIDTYVIKETQSVVKSSTLSEDKNLTELSHSVDKTDFVEDSFQVADNTQNIEEQQYGVSENETENLLKIAQREIAFSAIQERHNNVDAHALLREVETDLEQSFREKIFESLKSGYQTVKTAVVKRNN